MIDFDMNSIADLVVSGYTDPNYVDRFAELDAMAITTQRIRVERVLSCEASIVLLERVAQLRRYLAHRAPRDDRVIPGRVACRASVYQPDIDDFLLGVDAKIFAALIRARSTTTAAVPPNARQGAGVYAPTFRSKSHDQSPLAEQRGLSGFDSDERRAMDPNGMSNESAKPDLSAHALQSAQTRTSSRDTGGLGS
jgi:hypothetical protein